jgi:hypothetical protein
MSIHPYKYIHIYSTSMSISERLDRLDLKIHKVGHEERLTVDGTSFNIERIISCKYNIHVK